MPPLRERKDDIPLLLTSFLQRFRQGSGKHPLTFAPEAMERMVEYHWPGNIREMENLVKYLLTVIRGDTIRLSDLPPLFDQAPSEVSAERADRSPLRPSGQSDQGNAAALSGYSWEEMEP